MRVSMFSKCFTIILASLFVFFISTVNAATPKNWTFLIFLNGNNNLDRWGTENLKSMEKIGSNDQVNIVVQWASLSKRRTVRLLVEKSTNPSQVTSPILQDLGSVDMGDYQSLQDFIKWGVENFPAEHYFINVWDHGGGWHYLHANSRINNWRKIDSASNDISYDEITGHLISTEHLGQSMDYAANLIGHKVDLYGSDACLMAMAEVADQMSNSVSYFAGSQEVEPAAGWPYTELLSRWEATPNATAEDVAKILTEEYVKSYQGGSSGTREVTFSAFDLSKLTALNQAVSDLGNNIKTLSIADRQKFLTTAKTIQTFADQDYGDLIDLTKKLKEADIQGLSPDVISNVANSAKQFVIANSTTTSYQNATGLSIWIPTSHWILNNYIKRYKGLKFNEHTRWGDALEVLVEDSALNH